MNIKTLMGFLGATLVAASYLTAAPTRGAAETHCSCKNCRCTSNNHCGCIFQADQQGSYNCTCADSCSCNSQCKCN